MSVTWTNNGSAPASATIVGSSWMVSTVPLGMGSNTITVLVTDAAYNQATRSITVTRGP